MKTANIWKNVNLAILLSLLMTGWGAAKPPSNSPTLSRNYRYPASWTDTDKYDLVWPAYAFARHGMFKEARDAVEQGDDTQAHYDQGLSHYSYWKKRNA